MKLNNYLLNLCDKSDTGTRGHICVEGISDIIKKIYLDIKNKEGKVNHILKELNIPYQTIYCWTNGRNPIPIQKAHELLKKWQEICGKSKEDINKIWDELFLKVESFSMCGQRMGVKLPKEISSELSYFMGFIIGDGHLKHKRSKEYSIYLYEEHYDFINILRNNWLNLFNTNINLYKEKKYSTLILRCTSKQIYRFFNKVLGLKEGNTTGYNFVPSIIGNCSEKLQTAFIGGFFDAEGSVGISNKGPFLQFTQASYTKVPPSILIWIQEKLKYDKGIMLNGPSQLPKQKSWRIRTASKPIILLFKEKISSRHPNKLKKFEQVRNFEYGKNKSRS